MWTCTWVFQIIMACSRAALLVLLVLVVAPTANAARKLHAQTHRKGVHFVRPVPHHAEDVPLKNIPSSEAAKLLHHIAQPSTGTGVTQHIDAHQEAPEHIADSHRVQKQTITKRWTAPGGQTVVESLKEPEIKVKLQTKGHLVVLDEDFVAEQEARAAAAIEAKAEPKRKAMAEVMRFDSTEAMKVYFDQVLGSNK